MSARLHSKRVLVTAAGQGIGRAIALAAAAEGAQVLATDINEDALARLREAGLETARLDVTDRNAVERLFADHAIDALAHCAGIVHGGTLTECTEEDWDAALALNVTAAFWTVRAAAEGMLARGGGSIVLVGSVASSIVGAPNRFVYGVTKAALVGMTKSIAVDFAAAGLRCNIVCPGTVQTPSLDDRIAAGGDPERTRAAFVARQPMGRLGAPEEIAATAVHLLSDESAYTTGQTFVVDGGWTAA